MDLYLGKRKLTLDPADSIAKGGEADIFKVDPTHVLKLFKQPDHPDLAGMKEEQDAARFRLEQHQTKLLALIQKKLPAGVIGPVELAYDKKKHIIGYSMPLIENANTLLAYSDMNFKKSVPHDILMEVMRQLFSKVNQTHKQGIVIGDFNDLNVLVSGNAVSLIDVDSYQFDQWYSYVFTQRFLDPLLASFTPQGLALVKPYIPDADWYAFAIMVMQTLLSAGPYSGITAVKSDQGKRLKQGERVQRRLTIFSPQVNYPANAVPYGYIPDDLLHHLHLVFEKDQRGEFPSKLLQFQWQECKTCGIWHARPQCPGCAQPAPASVKQTVQIRGSVTSTRIFKTNGHLLFATLNNDLRYLYWESGVFYREGKKEVHKGQLDTFYRYRIQQERTFIGRQDKVAVFENGNTTMFSIDSVQNLATFDANHDNYFWVKAGRLQKDHPMGSETIGEVLPNQTYFWVGEKKGFGFYNAGLVKMAFIFSTQTKGINDNIPPLDYTGQLVDSTVVFGRDTIWVFYASNEKGIIKTRCRVYDHVGHVVAQAEGEYDDGTWMGRIRGKSAMGNGLLSITPAGITRLRISQNSIVEDTEFPDTETFVNLDCHLFISPKGLYVVDRHEVRLITIK